MWHLKKYSKAVNETKDGSKFAEKKNELVLTSGERGRKPGGAIQGFEGGRVITGLYEIMCVETSENCKHYGNLKNLSLD